MCKRIVWDPANRCVRSQGSQERPCDSDRRGGRKAARTFAKTTAERAGAGVLASISDQPHGRKLKVHQSVRCDKKWGISCDVPFCLASAQSLSSESDSGFLFFRMHF